MPNGVLADQCAVQINTNRKTRVIVGQWMGRKGIRTGNHGKGIKKWISLQAVCKVIMPLVNNGLGLLNQNVFPIKTNIFCIQKWQNPRIGAMIGIIFGVFVLIP